MPRAFFTPRWIITTLLVVAAVAVMVRLGFWQLDRLEERRAFNARVEAQIDAPPLDLNQGTGGADSYEMEYRAVQVTGTYDPANEILWRNQVYDNQPGYHLLTPLRIEGTGEMVLVDRGFIPTADGAPEQRAKYAQAGLVTVRGILRRSNLPRFFGAKDPTLTPGQARLEIWNYPDLERIEQQLGAPLLPVYIQQAPEEGETGASAAAPVAGTDLPELSEGPHMGYALQWFAFAALLGIGYPFFVRKQLGERR